jgi:RNA polymerase sigma-70 factor (ECF subfamily)
MEETRQVKRARAGDKKALEDLLYENCNSLYAYLLRLTMNEDIAKDISQEVMVKAILNIKGFKGRSKFSTWLISIASNSYKDFLRKNKRLSQIPVDNLSIRASDDPEKDLISKDRMSQLREALLKLPEEKRMVFILKHRYGYSYKEIGKIVKCPVGTVRSRLHYCIKSLKESLTEKDDIDG